MPKHENTSEVAQLRQQIAEEYEAMKRGLIGLSSGTTRHDFLRAKMQHTHDYHSQLAHHVGEQEATQTVCEIYNDVMN